MVLNLEKLILSLPSHDRSAYLREFHCNRNLLSHCGCRVMVDTRKSSIGILLNARSVGERFYRVNEEENENCSCEPRKVRSISGRNAALQ